MDNEQQGIKRIVLCILDGVGINLHETNDENAWSAARKATFDALLKCCPNTTLQASGKYVGLPDGQMGNSEVGHMTIGAGRIIPQDLVRINDLIAHRGLFYNEALLKIVKILTADVSVSKNNVCHIFGLASDGGVHAHIEHMIAITEVLISHGVMVNLHLITDGRDTPPKSAAQYLRIIMERLCVKYGKEKVRIMTVCGRYYAMDRDNRIERTNLTYDAIVFGKSNVYFDDEHEIEQIICQNYRMCITDEFMKPFVRRKYTGIQHGDCMICTNFRADRILQIMGKLADLKQLAIRVGIKNYSNNLSLRIETILPDIKLSNTLGDVIAHQGKTQIKIAETEKYAHVTFFFNGGVEHALQNERRILIPSPKVKTYDVIPEMSAYSITHAAIESQKLQYDTFLCINYANADMVGHTGVFEAGVKACETIDLCVRQLLNGLLDRYTIAIITADHGNIENLRKLNITDCDNTNHNLQPNTQHSSNPVPFILVDYYGWQQALHILQSTYDSGSIKYPSTTPQYNAQKLRSTHTILRTEGSVADIAPTILELLQIDKPEEMNGTSLLSAMKQRQSEVTSPEEIT